MEKFMENYVNESTLIGKIVNDYPEAAEILQECGMHCLGCPTSQEEELWEACMVHGLDTEAVIKALNEKIAEKGK